MSLVPRFGRFGRLSFLGLILGLFLLPAQAHAWQAKRDVKRQIEQLEDQWRVAQLTGDIPTMDRMLSDDYVGITLTGQVTTKAQQLARLRDRVFVLTRMDKQDSKIKLVGQVAIVTVKARVEGRTALKAIDGEYRYTRIYHQLASGTWKITNFEATRIPNRRGGIGEPHNGQAS